MTKTGRIREKYLTSITKCQLLPRRGLRIRRTPLIRYKEIREELADRKIKKKVKETRIVKKTSLR